MSIIASLFAVALLAQPQQPSCVAATQTGTFRFTAVDASQRDRGSTQVGIIVLENIDGCLEATVLTDAGAPSVIGALQLNGDHLSGSIRTTSGYATVRLELEPGRVAGSIVDGQHVWEVRGKRTSDAAPRANGH